MIELARNWRKLAQISCNKITLRQFKSPNTILTGAGAPLQHAQLAQSCPSKVNIVLVD
jgi:hypothetical protein